MQAGRELAPRASPVAAERARDVVARARPRRRSCAARGRAATSPSAAATVDLPTPPLPVTTTRSRSSRAALRPRPPSSRRRARRGRARGPATPSRARVVDDLAGVARAVGQVGQARVAGAQRVGEAHARPGATRSGRRAAGAPRRARPGCRRARSVAVAVEDDEELVLGGVPVRRAVRARRAATTSWRRPRAHRAGGAGDVALGGGDLADLVGVELDVLAGRRCTAGAASARAARAGRRRASRSSGSSRDGLEPQPGRGGSSPRAAGARAAGAWFSP